MGEKKRKIYLSSIVLAKLHNVCLVFCFVILLYTTTILGINNLKWKMLIYI